MFEEAVVSRLRFVSGGGVRVCRSSNSDIAVLLPIDPGSIVTIDLKVGQAQNVIFWSCVLESQQQVHITSCVARVKKNKHLGQYVKFGSTYRTWLIGC